MAPTRRWNIPWSPQVDKGQDVTVAHGQLIIGRHALFGRFEERYSLLEVHDLHVDPSGGRRIGPLAIMLRQMELHERIVFTRAGVAHSFGGAIEVDAAQAIVDGIIEHDREVRRGLGMSDTPNAATFDRDRFLAASAVDWDPDVPMTAL